MTKTIEGAIVDFLEDVPIKELSDYASVVVERFRLEEIDFEEAKLCLENDCYEEMVDYINRNKSLYNLIASEH